jgi:hypothetical protein
MYPGCTVQRMEILTEPEGAGATGLRSRQDVRGVIRVMLDPASYLMKSGRVLDT